MSGKKELRGKKLNQLIGFVNSLQEKKNEVDNELDFTESNIDESGEQTAVNEVITLRNEVNSVSKQTKLFFKQLELTLIPNNWNIFTYKYFK